MSHKALIIGGSRFVGPHLLKLLQNDNCDITVFNRGNNALDYGSATYVQGDRNKDFGLLADEKFDVVYDMCAYTAEDTQKVIDEVNFDFLAHFGSVASYLESELYPIREDYPQGASYWGSYGSNKAECEKVLEASKIKYVSLRPTYILGEKNYVDRENFIYKKLLAEEELMVPGDGRALVQFVFVDEVAKSLYLLGKNRVEGAYNCVNDDYITLKGLLAEMGKLVGKEPNIVNDFEHDLEEWDDEIFPFANAHMIYSNATLKQAIDIKFTPLLDHLRQDWENYYKDNLK
jgi:2'-hydroxyisoflavone reductase